MCGLTAIVSIKGAPIDKPSLERMTQAIEHRGPDDFGYYVGTTVGFGFRRLSILDLTPSGHQPMATPDGRYVVVFNGEIFNYIELRAELEKRGHRFRSTGDTEVLLYAFREWGFGCLEKFNGMWAFLVHDVETDKVFGARDRFGVKPLYYYHDGAHVLLASEIKSIRESGYYRGGVNWDTAARFFLRQELDNTEQTFMAGIRHIPPGHAFELDRASGELKLHRYWNLGAIAEQPAHADPMEEFGALLDDAVKLRLRSDVPVGITLSGGLDSTTIICSAARLKAAAAGGKAQPTLAFSFNVRDFDESRYINETVAQTGADLRQIDTDPLELWSQLDKVLWYHDEPVHSLTALVGFRIMGLAASNGVKVVLTGQGADETLAGYPSYFRNAWHSTLRAGQVGRLWSDLRAFSAVHGGSAGSYATQELVKAARLLVAGSAPYRALVRRKRGRDHAAGDPWFTSDLVGAATPSDETPDFTLRGALLRSVERSQLPMYLRVEDRNSMAHSLEARVPFLDYRLVSLAFRLSSKWKMRGPWNKYVLRESMRGRIPESVRTRPDKMGFPTPVGRWFRGELFDSVSDLVRSRCTAERGIYRTDRIVSDLERHRRGEIDISNRLFNVVQFERWLAVTGTSAAVV